MIMGCEGAIDRTIKVRLKKDIYSSYFTWEKEVVPRFSVRPSEILHCIELNGILWGRSIHTQIPLVARTSHVLSFLRLCLVNHFPCFLLA